MSETHGDDSEVEPPAGSGEPPPSGTPAREFSQDARSIAVQTPLGKDALLLRSFRGDEGLSRLFRFELDLLSEQATVDAAVLLGKAITVGIRLADGTDRFFNGIVSRFALVGGEGRFTAYRAEMVPWTWMLTRTSDCRVFQNLSLPAIVEKVFRDLGFQDYKNRLQAVYPAREYTVQYRETDFNFVSRLLEQSGICYFFEHENGKHTLVMTDSGTEHRPCPGLPQGRFRALAAGDYEADVVSAWSLGYELRPAKYALGAYNFESPNTNLTVNVESLHAPETLRPYEIYDFPGDFQKRDEGEALVGIRIEEQEAQFATVTGASTCRALISGFRFTLTEHPHESLNQAYLVTAVSHAVVEPSYVAKEQTEEGRYRNTLMAMPVTVPFRPLRVTPRPVIHGVQTAIVVGKKGEELWVDKHGRVKVQFHWDREGKRDETSSCWVRVSQQWAGKRWGALFLPRIGQEVIVEFVDGNPDCPIITGRVYNGDQTPPYDLPTEQTKSTMKSASSKGGGGFNEVRFEDKKGSEQLFIHAQRDEDLVVEVESREWVGGNRHTIVEKNRFEHVGAEQHLKVVGDLVEEVTGARHARAAKGLFVKTGATIVLDSDTELTLKAAGGFITINAAGITIQGTLVNINSGGTAVLGLARSAKPPQRASSAGAAGGPSQGETPPMTPEQAAIARVELYREALKQNGAKMSESDRADYEKALAELEDATARNDSEGMARAKAKLDAILTKNGIPIPPDPVAAAGVVAAAPGSSDATLRATNESGPIHTSGATFRDQQNALWRWKGATDFRLLHRFLAGEDIKSIVAQRGSLGINNVRVLAMAVNLFNLNPGTFPDYFDKLGQFFDLLAAMGMRCELVVLADSATVMPSISDQRSFLDRVSEVARTKWNVFLELANEFGHSTNRVDISAFSKPAGVVSSRGSGLGDEAPALPGWDYLTVHTGRTRDWPRKMRFAQEMSDKYHIPCVNNEPIGAADRDEPGRRSSNLPDWFDAGAVAGLMSCGATFHSQNGLQSELYSPTQESCARAFFKGMDTFPTDSQTWKYTRGGLSDCPVSHVDTVENVAGQVFDPQKGADRTFVMYTAQEAWGVAVQRGPQWRLEVLRGRADKDDNGVFHIVF